MGGGLATSRAIPNTVVLVIRRQHAKDMQHWKTINHEMKMTTRADFVGTSYVEAPWDILSLRGSEVGDKLSLIPVV